MPMIILIEATSGNVQSLSCLTCHDQLVHMVKLYCKNLKMLEYNGVGGFHMPGRVVIKLGGGLITDKSSHKSVNYDAIDSSSRVILEIVRLGYSPIIVHGAGSFGHLSAKKWGIAGGLDPKMSTQQWDAVSNIRSDMKELCGILTDRIEEAGLDCDTFPPSQWARGTGSEFTGSISMFERGPDDPIPITFGDVVETYDSREFGILSGDDIMLRISMEVHDVSHVIFLIGDAPGIMDKPPKLDGAVLLEEWRPSDNIDAEHKKDIDVTGGISLKMSRACEISKHVEHVWIIDGREPNRILELLSNGQTIGTRILPS